MGLELGALPGTVRTASVILQINGLLASNRGLTTISLQNDVQFNESDAKAWFSLLFLHYKRQDDVLLRLVECGDIIEEWPRFTVRREFTIEVENIGSATVSEREIELLLWGYPPAPTAKIGEFQRLPPLPLADTNSIVKARNKLSVPLVTKWQVIGP